MSKSEKYFIVGGAGFVGSHFTDYLLSKDETQKVTIYDNFSSGREWHYNHHLKDNRLSIIRADVKQLNVLTESMKGHDIVIHLASNPDIARAATEPDIDFKEGVLLTHNVIEAMRLTKTTRIIYTSGSGVYGDLNTKEINEDFGPLLPISTYGASKLAGEAFISSYCYMFGLTACVFRFANVVGPRQTHGVGYDFARRLLKDPSNLKIYGDGNQSKSYIHIEDIVAAVFLANEKSKKNYDVFNVGTGDYITVREIADIVLDCLGLKNKVKYEFTGGDRGWKGDVPIVRLNTDKICSLGWKCKRNSAQSIKDSVISLIQQLKEGLIK